MREIDSRDCQHGLAEDLDGQVPSERAHGYDEFADLLERAAAALRAAEVLQAKIDSLMLEYCPDEMTPEQIDNWAKNQKPVDLDENEKLMISML